MKRQYWFVLILAIGLCILPLAAQDQTEKPAATNPLRYGNTSPAGVPYSQNESLQSQTVPPSLTLLAGTLLRVRLSDTLSSDHNNPGDGFATVLDQPIIVQGWVVSRRGQMAVGQVAVAEKAGRTKGVSQLAIELNELVLVDGQQVPIRTQLVQTSAGTSRGSDLSTVGTTTGIGAAIGATAGGGEGAAIGAAAGAAAAAVGILSTRGRATELYPETLLTFSLQDAVTISTEQGRQAFKPVSQQDYAGSGEQRNPQRNFRVVEDYPTPYYYPPYYYYSPYRYYGYYGFGSRIYITPRGYFGGSHRGHR
jgi:hypothetical protein